MSVLFKNDKIDKIKKCLEDLNAKTENKGCVLCSEEGLVVISAKNGDIETDFDALAAMGASLLDMMNDRILLDVLISYENRKVFVRKIEGDICNLIFINIFAGHKRYFRREVNNTVKKINKLLAAN